MDYISSQSHQMPPAAPSRSHTSGIPARSLGTSTVSTNTLRLAASARRQLFWNGETDATQHRANPRVNWENHQQKRMVFFHVPSGLFKDNYVGESPVLMGKLTSFHLFLWPV